MRPRCDWLNLSSPDALWTAAWEKGPVDAKLCPWAVRWADALGAVPGRPWDGICHTGDVIGHTRDVLGRPVDGRIVPRTSTGQWTHYGRSTYYNETLTFGFSSLRASCPLTSWIKLDGSPSALLDTLSSVWFVLKVGDRVWFFRY